MSILKKLEKFFIAFLKWFLSWQTRNITTFPSPYRLTATPRTEEIKNKKELVASTSSATKSFITRCLSLSKAASKKPHNFITSSPRKIPHTVASTSSATKSFITRCLSLPKAHYFYCIKIRALYRTSLMFLWELKNAIISTTLCELCDIKTIRKIPPFRVGEKNFSQ